MDLQRSLDRKKGEEGKRNLKKIIIIYRRTSDFPIFLKRCKRVPEYSSDRRDFQRPDGISALVLQSFIVLIYSGIRF